MPKAEIGIIGGSGLYGMSQLEDLERVVLSTPYGPPSDTITIGSLHNVRLAFLPRHGEGHFLTPSEVPYLANIHALKQLGIKYVIAISACGSLREDYKPGQIIIPDQLVDLTKGKREYTFFGGGLVAHIGVADPFSPELNAALLQAVRDANGVVHNGGTFITIEGPRFSTRGESELYRSWGMSLVGMTTSPEAFLAAEAEIAYSVMAHVTDYDVWHASNEPVTVESVVKILKANTEIAQSAISHLVQAMDDWAGNFPAHHALEDALGLISDWSKIPSKIKDDLKPIIGKYYR